MPTQWCQFSLPLSSSVCASVQFGWTRTATFADLLRLCFEEDVVFDGLKGFWRSDRFEVEKRRMIVQEQKILRVKNVYLGIGEPKQQQPQKFYVVVVVARKSFFSNLLLVVCCREVRWEMASTTERRGITSGAGPKEVWASRRKSLRRGGSRPHQGKGASCAKGVPFPLSLSLSLSLYHSGRESSSGENV